MSTLVSRIGRITSENKKNNSILQYVLEIEYPHKKNISLINHIEYGFIFDGIMNQAVLNIFERKNIHPEYFYSNLEILSMSEDQRAKLLATQDFENNEQLNKYCLDNYVHVVSTYIITN